ncbi:ferritin family protein [Candidatus Moduliflexota bacterium]
MVRFKELSDIFEVAVRIERHSVGLYVRLYQAVHSSRAKEVFARLGAEEEIHLGRFRAMLEEVADYEPSYIYPGEYELYVDGMAQRALESFHDMDRDLGIRTAEEAIAVAVNLEKGKISFYSEAAEEFDGDPKALIGRLIEEERSHLGKLEELLSTYPEGGEES